MLEDCRPCRCCSPRRRLLAPAAGARRRRVLCLDADRDARSPREPPSAPAAVAPGQPGLRHLHLGLDRPAQGGDERAPRRSSTACSGCRRPTASTPADRVLQKTPFSFDVSVWEFFWPLMTGARLVVARPGGHQDPAYLARPHRRARRSPRCTSSPRCCRPSWRSRGARSAARSLRARGRAAARRCPPELRAALLRASAGAELHNLYGPTEAAVDVTCVGLPAAASGGARAHRPADRQHRASTSLDRAAAPGAGRACRASCTSAASRSARGYLGAAGAHRRALRPRSLRGEPGARLYRTGDLARWRAGRRARVPGPARPPGQDPRLPHRAGRDRGRARRASGGARGRRRASRTARAATRSLVAYVVPVDERCRRARSCAASSRERPAGATWCRPSSWARRAAAHPQRQGGPQGACRPPAPGPPATRRSAEPPRTPIEELLAGDLGRGAGRRAGRASTTTSSRSAATRCWPPRSSRGSARAFGVELPLRALFEAPDRRRPGGARSRLRLAERRQGRPPAPPPRADRGAPLPLSFAQQRLWFLDQLSRAARPTTSRRLLRCEGELDAAALRAQPRRDLSARHEALRTTFRWSAGGEPGPGDRAGGACGAAGDRSAGALSGPARGRGGSSAPRLGGAARPFDLAAARCCALRPASAWSEQRPPCSCSSSTTSSPTAGPSVSSCESWRALYLAFRGRRNRDCRTSLPPLPVQYADFAVWQRRVAARRGAGGAARLLARAAGRRSRALELPTDRPRPAVQSFRGGSRPLRACPPS